MIQLLLFWSRHRAQVTRGWWNVLRIEDLTSNQRPPISKPVTSNLTSTRANIKPKQNSACIPVKVTSPILWLKPSAARASVKASISRRPRQDGREMEKVIPVASALKISNRRQISAPTWKFTWTRKSSSVHSASKLWPAIRRSGTTWTMPTTGRIYITGSAQSSGVAFAAKRCRSICGKSTCATSTLDSPAKSAQRNSRIMLVWMPTPRRTIQMKTF